MTVQSLFLQLSEQTIVQLRNKVGVISFRKVEEEEDEPLLLTTQPHSADSISPLDCCISSVSPLLSITPCNKGKCQFPPSVSFSSSCFSLLEKRRLIHFCTSPPRDKNSAYASALMCAITFRPHRPAHWVRLRSPPASNPSAHPTWQTNGEAPNLPGGK